MRTESTRSRSPVGMSVGNGAGETIAIVTAYNDPNITSDLAAFDKEYGLSAPSSFTVKNLGGSTTDAGWALERRSTLNGPMPWHPLRTSFSSRPVQPVSQALFSAVSYASKQAGVSVVSMSWGTTEFFGESSYDSVFTTPAGHAGVTYVAASGDSGAWTGQCTLLSRPTCCRSAAPRLASRAQLRLRVRVVGQHRRVQRAG